ncbi:hypothetical protein EG329_014164 [Mollisiaceae sp. DMI_Dod_QoI]|nr:hypothetical protein EG329_014164 [Helotiales sp. DMI_Dod_QoI]
MQRQSTTIAGSPLSTASSSVLANRSLPEARHQFLYALRQQQDQLPPCHYPLPPGYKSPHPFWTPTRTNGLSKYLGSDWAAMGRVMLKNLLRMCWNNDLVTVIAAGNNEGDLIFDLGQRLPARTGTSDNTLNTIEACDISGMQNSLTTKAIGNGDLISTNTQGDSVEYASPGASGF